MDKFNIAIGFFKIKLLLNSDWTTQYKTNLSTRFLPPSGKD